MKKSFILLVIGVLACCTAAAQSRNALRINEVMVVNDGSSVVDDYGQYVSWIELFNSAHASLEISSVYLTTDPEQPKMYPVPLGDVNTKMPKRQHVIFWADSAATKGTFHTNFKLYANQPNWIGIYDADGKTLIDSVTVPASLPAGASYARKVDGVICEPGDTIQAWEVRDGSSAQLYITPSSNNLIKDTNDKVETFHEHDGGGVILTVMAMVIVFSALLVLYLCFKVISKIGAHTLRTNKMKSQGIAPKDSTPEDRPEHDLGEEIAAIVMALHEHLDAHDTEQTVLTINKVKKAYSPWSSKIYSMRELPKR